MPFLLPFMVGRGRSLWNLLLCPGASCSLSLPLISFIMPPTLSKPMEMWIVLMYLWVAFIKEHRCFQLCLFMNLPSLLVRENAFGMLSDREAGVHYSGFPRKAWDNRCPSHGERERPEPTVWLENLCNGHLEGGCCSFAIVSFVPLFFNSLPPGFQSALSHCTVRRVRATGWSIEKSPF